jgi:hypothetical protein
VGDVGPRDRFVCRNRQMQLKIGEGCGSILTKAVDLFLERLWTYFYLELYFLFLIEAMFVLLVAAEFRLFKGYVVLFCQLSFGLVISRFSCNRL